MRITHVNGKHVEYNLPMGRELNETRRWSPLKGNKMKPPEDVNLLSGPPGLKLFQVVQSFSAEVSSLGILQLENKEVSLDFSFMYGQTDDS